MPTVTALDAVQSQIVATLKSLRMCRHQDGCLCRAYEGLWCTSMEKRWQERLDRLLDQFSKGTR